MQRVPILYTVCVSSRLLGQRRVLLAIPTAATPQRRCAAAAASPPRPARAPKHRKQSGATIVPVVSSLAASTSSP
eukprot:scaffold43852_cov73-Phaeocystis_antarctica.AAC.5